MELVVAALGAAAIVAAVFVWRRAQGQLVEAERERRRAQSDAATRIEHLTESLQWLRRGVAASPDPILATNRELRIRYANPAAEALFGLPQDDDTIIRYLHSLDVEQLAQTALNGADSDGVEQVVEIDNHPYLARALATNEGVGIVLTDIAEIQRLARARQDMVANLSHELRTPLTSLRLLADTLLTPAGQDEKVVKDSAAKIAREVDLVHQMFQEMLDLSAIESGRQVVRLVAMPLKEVADAAVEQLQEQAASREREFEVDIDPGLRVLADWEQARRAIVNVLHNALKFAEGEEPVRLSASNEDEWIELRIEDDGPGLTPSDLERIFERFYRGDRARGTAGTGLGLAIARHIMAAHGGLIWAENRRPPVSGACFKLAFQPA